jgi:hypothetical protein
MVLRSSLLSFAAIALALATATPGATAAPSGGDLLANPGAESGLLAPWTGSGWGVARYGGPTAPTLEYSRQAPSVVPLGSDLFDAESPSAHVEQRVSLSELAASVDTGSQQLSFAAWLGGQASGGSAVASVRFGDEAARPIGSPIQLGPVVAGELSERPTLLECEAIVSVPVGARTATVTLQGAPGGAAASSYGIADSVFLSTSLIANPDSSQEILVPTATPDCSVPRAAQPIVVPPATAVVRASLDLGRVTTPRGARASASVACVGPSSSTCRGRLVLTVAGRVRRHRTGRDVEIGTAPLSLVAGRKATFLVRLNPTGRRLLHARHVLHVTLTALSVESAKREVVVAHRALTLRP